MFGSKLGQIAHFCALPSLKLALLKAEMSGAPFAAHERAESSFDHRVLIADEPPWSQGIGLYVVGASGPTGSPSTNTHR